MEMNRNIGVFSLAFGLYTLVARKVAPHQFAKLGPMKEKFGEKGGLIVHLIVYTIMPLLLGGWILYKTHSLGHF